MKDDCFYFIQSTCARREDCNYRHNPLVKATLEICKNWKNNLECDDNCNLRHSEYHLKKRQVCIWESRGGCKNPSCTYEHTCYVSSLIDLSCLNTYLEDSKEE
ncbi:hypothetical protein NEOKW01_1438 [Nematocida sp. AWRm80]|nr:hypothetical protein NEOKW01_1438 [Nematocida sp. AWRm80]